MTALSLPVLVLPVIAPFAAMIAAIGIDAWCEWAANPTDEPAPS